MITVRKLILAMLRCKGSYVVLILVLLLVGGLLGFSTVSPGRAAPVKPSGSPADHVVISEFRTRGKNGAYDEFIELFNPGSSEVNIGAWIIKRSSGCKTSSPAMVATIVPETILRPGGHYLLANSTFWGTQTPTYSPVLSVDPDQLYSQAIADDGGIAVLLPDGTSFVDQAGMCDQTLYFEGTPLPPLPDDGADRTYERLPGGSVGGCYDTDNNSSDFMTLIPGDPQNYFSALTICELKQTPLLAPTGLTATVASQTQIDLSWTDNSDDEAGFKVQRSPSGVNNWSSLTTTGASITSYSDTSATCGTAYDYRVIATNSGGDSGPSNIASAITVICSPAAPTGLTATVASQTQIDLSWADNSNNEAGFKVERSPSGADTWSLLTTTGADVTSYSDASALCGTAYDYRVKATNLGGDSDPSNTASATTMICNPVLTSTPVAPSHMVISELRSRGPNGSSDEFIELYNPTGAAVNLSGWTIRRSSCIGSTTASLVTITSNTILQPGQHYLVAATGSSMTGVADQTFTASLADNGGVALVNLFGTPVDQVGMCISTLYREGTNLTPLEDDLNQSYERLLGGNTSCYDTDNNAADFALISQAYPQNKASQAVMCFNVLTSTPTSTPTATATRTPTTTRTPTLTRTPTAFPTPYPGVMAINEFLPHPRSDWNADGKIDTDDEYIELINMGTNSVNLKNWKLDNGTDGPSTPYTLPSMTLLPRQIVILFRSETGVSLSDGGSTVRLVKPDGRTADIYTYPVVLAADRTWCRLPDGNGAFGFSCRPTPGRPNARLGSETPAPGSVPPAESACSLGDTVPAAILQAECEAFGAGIWHQMDGDEFWLRGRWKWDVFLE